MSETTTTVYEDGGLFVYVYEPSVADPEIDFRRWTFALSSGMDEADLTADQVSDLYRALDHSL